MHFVHQFQCFEVFLQCVFVLFKHCVFSQKLCEPLSASIDPICFSINRICFKIFKEAFVCFDQSKLIFNQLKLIFDQSKLVNQVFKISEFDVSNLLFKKVFKLFLSLRIGQGQPTIFFIFLHIFLQGFPLHKPVSPLCPSFCILFYVFMHFLCISLGIFGTFQIGIFVDSSFFF